MSREMGYLGEQIQITNSKEFNSLKNKINPYCNSDYETITYNTKSIGDTIALELNLNRDKVSLLCLINNIGKVDGGDVTLNAANSILTDSNRIEEIDITRHNLYTIFPNFDNIFSEEEKEEFFDLILKRSKSREGKSVECAEKLNLIIEYMMKKKQWTSSDAMNFVRNQIEFMKNKGVIDIEDKYHEFIKSLAALSIFVDLENLNNAINSGISNNYSKEDFINLLSNIEIFEKKNKIR